MTPKRTYTTLLILYLLTILIWFGRDTLANKITGYNPDTIQTRSLTQPEYQAWLRVPKVDQVISYAFAAVSALFALVSFIFRKKRWFHPPIIPRIGAIIALLFFLLIVIANSISFIAPGPLV